MKTLVHFGAGNIGRSLVAPLFSAAGYEVVCVDAAADIAAALNSRGAYSVIIKDTLPPGAPSIITVTGVRGIDARDTAAVAAAVARADLCSTAVGAGVLPRIVPILAAGLAQRSTPLNIILCENLRNAAAFMRNALRPHLDPAALARVGLVETSIGKMVPIMPAYVRARDPLEVWAEAYNQIIADRDAFIGELPDVPGLVLKHTFGAYVDRKLFIHNLGHAAAAYFGHLAGVQFVWQAVADAAVHARVAAAMHESAFALHKQYPHELSLPDLQEHINDLLRRFANRALGDTVYRVGRDLPRKLAPNDRCMGALRLVCAQGGNPAPICAVIAAALRFTARDEHGRLFPADEEFHRQLQSTGVSATLQRVCGLDPARDAHLLALILS